MFPIPPSAPLLTALGIALTATGLFIRANTLHAPTSPKTRDLISITVMVISFAGAAAIAFVGILAITSSDALFPFNSIAFTTGIMLLGLIVAQHYIYEDATAIPGSAHR